MPLQVESLVLHEEAVRKGMVELDAKMSQFLVEYFLLNHNLTLHHFVSLLNTGIEM